MSVLERLAGREANRGRIDLPRPTEVEVIKHTYSSGGSERRSVRVRVSAQEFELNFRVDAPELIKQLVEAEGWRAV